MQDNEHVLLTCWGTLGEVNPVVRLARQLTARGNSVHVCGPSYAENLFEGVSASFSVIPSGLEHPDFKRDQPRFMSKRLGFESIHADIDIHADAAAARIHGVIIGQKISRVIHSWITPAAAVAARRAGVGSARLYLYPLALNQEADPPAMPRWPHATSEAQGIAARRDLRLRISSHFRKLLPNLIALAEDAGLPSEDCELFPAASPSSARLAIFDERLLLSGTGKPDFLKLEPQPAPHMPPELEEHIGKHGAPVLISLGSFTASNKPQALGRLLSALRALSLPAVAVLGRPGPQSTILRGKTLVLANCPLPAALPHCRLVIHHGGIGSLQETLAAGRVSLTVPLQYDQFDNARRLETLGLATSARLSRLDSNALASLIEKTLADQQTADRCKAWPQH